VGKKTKMSANGELDELRELVADGAGDVTQKRTDRRGILKLAGAAVLGAAGAAALKAVPASAASGNAMIVGCANASSTQTTLTDSGTGANMYLVGSVNQYGLVAGGNSGSNEIGVWGASKTGSGQGVVGTATSGTGVAGTGTTGTGVLGASTSGDGVRGTSGGAAVRGTASGSGTGVVGTTGSGGVGVGGAGSDAYGGLFTSTTGYDVALGFPVVGGAVGSGRLGMVGRLDTGASAPPVTPGFQVTSTGHYTFEHELVRGNDSSIWASRFSASGTNLSRWKRINAVRVDAADGTGAPFTPFRLYDSRSGAKPAVNSVTHIQVTGAGTGASSIPSDAVAIIGNLTATQYTGPGFLALSPDNITVTTSSVNFQTGQIAIANAFVVGLNNGGKVQVKVASHASHFIVDVTGYLQ
jgi:hypothetical protein